MGVPCKRNFFCDDSVQIFTYNAWGSVIFNTDLTHLEPDIKTTRQWLVLDSDWKSLNLMSSSSWKRKLSYKGGEIFCNKFPFRMFHCWIAEPSRFGWFFNIFLHRNFFSIEKNCFGHAFWAKESIEYLSWNFWNRFHKTSSKTGW